MPSAGRSIRRVATQAHAEARVDAITADLARRMPTRGDRFAMEVAGRTLTQRRAAGAALLTKARLAAREGLGRRWTIGRIGGFDLTCTIEETAPGRRPAPALALLRTDFAQPIDHRPRDDAGRDHRAAGAHPRSHGGRTRRAAASRQRRAARLAGYEPRLGETFPLQSELDDRLARLAEIEADLARTDGVTSETAPPQHKAA